MCESSDPRDNIYAMAGRASGVRKEELVPNYSKPFTDVYMDLVVYTL